MKLDLRFGSGQAPLFSYCVLRGRACMVQYLQKYGVDLDSELDQARSGVGSRPAGGATRSAAVLIGLRLGLRTWQSAKAAHLDYREKAETES